MSEIRVGENESLESALKRFKRKCARAGVMVCTEAGLPAVLPCFLACCARLRALCTETVSLKRIYMRR